MSKELEQSYLNSYNLLLENCTYEELAKKGSFMLPQNHEDASITLAYYEKIEDYQKCIKIRDRQKP
tara:strand:- start:451 stop:648 length:198 start_codon:yes stop_codon:yes gene_type:complete